MFLLMIDRRGWSVGKQESMMLRKVEATLVLTALLKPLQEKNQMYASCAAKHTLYKLFEQTFENLRKKTYIH